MPLLEGMRPRLPRLLMAIALGALSLGSALALAGVSAWLITRAWQMPPVLDLSVAVVAVRTLGISRGVLGYCERLAAHDVALSAAGNARVEIYRRLAVGPADVATRLHTGELLARVGADVDTCAETLVRSIVPIGVALLLGIASVSAIAVISPTAAAILAGCLFIAGVIAPWLAARAAEAQEHVASRRHSARDATAVIALDHAPELRVAGRLDAVIAAAEREQQEWGKAMDRAAAPAAAALATPTAAAAASVIGAVIVAIGIAPTTAPTTLAILMLLPLAAFEATAALPAAAISLTRSRIAANRLRELVPPSPPPVVAAAATPQPRAAPSPTPTPYLRATELRYGYPGSPAGQPLSLEVPPGARVIVTGDSGAGKTTLLMTLAGLRTPISGSVTLDAVPTGGLTEAELRSAVCYFAEDAHLFATTVRDNLLVARGDCSDAELTQALDQVGLGTWLKNLPNGLSTVLHGGAPAVSAGQRRRLLLARVLLCPAPVVLLDEPTEHLDADDADEILSALLNSDGGLLGSTRTAVIATPHPVAGGYPDCRLSIPPDVECEQ